MFQLGGGGYDFYRKDCGTFSYVKLQDMMYKRGVNFIAWFEGCIYIYIYISGQVWPEHL